MENIIEKIEIGIKKIGNDLVNCDKDCQGICINIEKGVLPRYLIFEKERIGSKGCVIIGINPGGSSEKEEIFFKNKLSYDATVKYWNDSVGKTPYYCRLRELVYKTDFTGPILWTELVKCENAKDSIIPLQTFRTCTNKYLCKEIELIPKDWTLVAVGREAHKALSYLFPDRSVLGIPHPTSSRGYFSWLYKDKENTISKEDVQNFKEDVQKQIKDFLNSKIPIEIWLDGSQNSSGT